MQLTILGTSAGGPFHGRHYTAQVLQIDNHLFLIDCGEGAQMQLYHHRIKIDRCNHIFISHLHGDHVYGLIGLLTSWCLKKRTESIHLFAPPGLQELVETTARICRVVFPYDLVFHEVDASVSTLVFENSKMEVWTIPLDHRIETSGWLFREKPKQRHIRPEKIEQYAIPYALIPGIKAGDDLLLPDGSTVPNAEMTEDPAAPRSFAFCSDTAPSELVAETVRGVDVLYHEATFTNEHLAEAEVAFHSTAEQAAEIARRAGVKRLLLGHFSGRYSNTEQHLAEARAVFPESYATEDGEVVEI
ncbi:MAG: ribonuclease Z [Lewinellaceae bacterium]|nr:ribonuclease Z [Lewinellaceae bacterium]